MFDRALLATCFGALAAMLVTSPSQSRLPATNYVLPAETASRILRAALPEAIIEVFEAPANRVGDLRRRSPPRDEPRLERPEELRCRSHRCPDNGTATCQCFHRRDPEPLVGKRGEDEQIGCSVELVQDFVRHPPEEAHGVGQTETSNQLSQGRRKGSIAGNRELEAHTGVLKQLRGVQKLLKSHPWLETTHRKEEGDADGGSPPGPHRGSIGRRCGMKRVSVHSPGDEHRAIGNLGMGVQQQLAAELAQGEDERGPPHGQALEQDEGRMQRERRGPSWRR